MKRMTTRKIALGGLPAGALLALLTGCAATAPMELPAFDFPAQFRGESQDPSVSLADTDWRNIYTDAALQSLSAEALKAGPDALLAPAHNVVLTAPDKPRACGSRRRSQWRLARPACRSLQVLSVPPPLHCCPGKICHPPMWAD